MPQPELFKGPLWDDLKSAAEGGTAVGTVAGFFLGGLCSAFRPVNLVKFTFYSGGLVGTFLVAVVLFSRT